MTREIGCGPLVNWPLIAVDVRNEVSGHSRPLVFLRLIAGKTRHASAALATARPGVPRLVGMLLTNPSGVVTNCALHSLTPFRNQCSVIGSENSTMPANSRFFRRNVAC